jgi:TIR domain
MTASEQSANRIFLSYRRDDSAYAAGWLFDRLIDQFGAGQVFKDVDSIGLGDNFAEKIQDAVKLCSVCLALIGPRWLEVTRQDGSRRLDDPEDFVRLEIEESLIRNIPVIPILVDGAHMPSRGDLPNTLQNLTFRNALELSPGRFGSDFARLLSALEGLEPSDAVRQHSGPAARKAGAAALGTNRETAAPAWLNPASVQTIEDYVTALRRTWVRAGAPGHEEIERCTGGLVSREKAANVLGGYGDGHFWTPDDFASALLVLDALGAPDQVVSQWRKAGSRTERQAVLARARLKRAKFFTEFRRGIPVILLAIVLCLATGLAIANLGSPPGPRVGNWAAFVFTCLIFGALLTIFGFFAYDEMSGSRSKADVRFLQVLFICCIASLTLGLLVSHIGVVGQTHTMRHIGLDVRNWLIWRF